MLMQNKIKRQKQGQGGRRGKKQSKRHHKVKEIPSSLERKLKGKINTVQLKEQEEIMNSTTTKNTHEFFFL